VEIPDKKVDQKFNYKREILATKLDIAELRSELLKTIYLVSLGQLLAIMGSVMAIVNLLK